uniref:50S ribosomal protein L35 n=1 Tax=Phaeostrophion irregulare TaxID=243268 RepID=UPI002E76C1F6|nr:50S ribosomal protein L35 [Phaeostrophion irregulare]WAM64324.1 50S ribosomal protein L35 [Phaeostrophion irregulare]
MGKLKIRKAAKKRYKIITEKRFMRRKAFKGHLLEKKSHKQKRNLANTIMVNKADTKAIRIMLVC